MNRISLARWGVAEFVGTFALIFIGAGSSLFGNPGAAIAQGLVIAVMVTAFAGVSGGHFNPAVTLGFLVTRRIPAKVAAFYWVVQLLGATAAALLIDWIFTTISKVPGQSGVNNLHLGAPSLQLGITSGQGVAIEAILTFFLVLIVFATAVDPGGAFDKIAGLAIGFTILFGILMAGQLTGGAINPARAFGPELVGDNWKNAWVWYVGPLAGGALAAVLYEMLYLGRDHPEEEEPPAAVGMEEAVDDADEPAEPDDSDAGEVVATDEPTDVAELSDDVEPGAGDEPEEGHGPAGSATDAPA